MPKYGRREQHPALLLYILSMVCLLFVVVLGFISVFVPWASKDLAVGQRAWAYPFKTCIQQTFSKANEHTCLDNDFIVGTVGAPVTQGDSTCVSFVLTTIAFVFISVIGGVLLLLAMLVLLYKLYSRPVCFALVVEVCLFIIMASCVIAWSLWIAFVERTCKPNTIFPIQSYSYGFVLYIFATFMAILAVILGFMAMMKVKNFKPNLEYGKDFDELGYIPAPEFPVLPAGASPAGLSDYYAYPAEAMAPAAPMPMQTPVGGLAQPAAYY